MKLCVTVLVFASVVVASFAAGIASIKSDIQQTLVHVKALDDAINKIPPNGGTLFQGIAVQSNVIKLEKALDKGTADVKSTPKFADDVSRDILALFKSIVGITVHLLKNIIAKKSSIANIPFPGITHLVNDALKKLQANTDAFENALIESYSENVKDEARSIKAEIDAAFEDAIRAYS